MTSDIWGARTKHSYISLTGHYLDKNFRLRRFLFAMKYFPEDHTAILSQNIEDADYLDADSLMATLLDNHQTQRYGATYTNKGGKSAAKENVIKEVDKYLGDAPAEKTVNILDF